MEDINKLYDMYAKDIYKFIISISLNHEVAEDIMQSTFLSAIKDINEIHYIQENKELYMSIMKKIQQIKEPQKQIVILSPISYLKAK